MAATAFDLGETLGLTEDERRAVELSSVDPDSGEHAGALAQLAIGVWWEGLTEEARCLIETAVTTAHRSGSVSAISSVHPTSVHSRVHIASVEHPR